MNPEKFSHEVLRRLRHSPALTAVDVSRLSDDELYALAGIDPARLSAAEIDSALLQMAAEKTDRRDE